MAKIKKFDVLTVPIEVKYTNLIVGWLFCVFAWLILVRIKKFNLTFNTGKPLACFYRLIVPHFAPRFMRGGAGDGE